MNEILGAVSGLGFGISTSAMFAIYALLFWYGGKQISDSNVDFPSMMRVIMVFLGGEMGGIIYIYPFSSFH